MIPEPLKIELQKPEIASLSDADAAAVLSAKTLAIRKSVDTSRVKQYAFMSGVWARIRLAMRNINATDDVYGLCVSVVDWIDDPSGKISTLDVDLPVVRANLAALVTAGLATQSQVDEIVAMADHVVSWSSYHGIGEIGIGLIRNARRELAQEEQRIIDNG